MRNNPSRDAAAATLFWLIELNLVEFVYVYRVKGLWSSASPTSEVGKQLERKVGKIITGNGVEIPVEKVYKAIWLGSRWKFQQYYPSKRVRRNK